MNHLTKFTLFCLVLPASLAVVVMGVGVSAQESGSTRAEVGGVLPVPDTANPLQQIRTLDDIRSLGELKAKDIEPGPVTYDAAGGFGTVAPSNFRVAALQSIRDLKEQLASPKADRSKIEPQLRTALTEYFIDDIRLRVLELDDIKAKLAETEAKIQKRLSSREEAVELQLKLMLREADGLGFFRSDDADALTPGGFGSEYGGEDFGGDGFDGGTGGPGLGLPGGGR